MIGYLNFGAIDSNCVILKVVYIFCFTIGGGGVVYLTTAGDPFIWCACRISAKMIFRFQMSPAKGECRLLVSF